MRYWLLVLLPLFAAEPAVAGSAVPQQTEFFESRIRPVLVERCYHCHNSAKDAQGGLALDYRDGLLKGGDGGKVITPGRPETSRLIAILKHDIAGLEMPEDSGKLSEKVIADFSKWIKDGVTDPRDEPPSARDLAKATSWEAKLAERKKWWSFQPVTNPVPPATTKDAGRLHYETEAGFADHRASHDIDRFIAAGLNASELKPAMFAQPNVLVRRAFFTLIGLPPTPDETAKWTKAIAANRQAGMEAMVDSLLGSPHFGERWARHWMDWIRYAESHGSEGDPRIDNAHLYRDYLIRALNADVPYDQLVREHIAGDLLEEPRINEELEINESMIGPAHWRMVFHGFAPTDALDEKVRFTDDQINAFSKAFLGLTVSCARCHDHKFDAISQKDYYALFGILGSTRPARAVIDVDAKINKNRDKLERLKGVIFETINRGWLTQAQVRNVEQPKMWHGLVPRLLQDESLWPKANQPSFGLYPWHLLKKQSEEKRTFGFTWKRLLHEWNVAKTKRATPEDPDYVYRWNLAAESDYAKWLPRGAGLSKKPNPPGTFALSPDADKLLTGVYPGGVYSHAISSKHPARLTSPTVRLDGNYDLWVRAIGGNGATVRYVVQNYPRNGTVFPVQNLSPQWKWHRFSLKYWEGDDIHVEITAGKDAPLLVKNSPRSWFGVREVIITKANSTVPTDNDWEWFDPLFEIAKDRNVESFEDLAQCYSDAAAAATRAWKRGDITDGQALFLDRLHQQGLLTSRFVNRKGTREEYRDLEGKIAEPTRVPGLDETVGRNQRLMTRGDHRQPEEEVPRRFLEAIDATPYDTKLSGRRELAEDVLRDDNPLSRRVIVNRVWHHMFGRGIVATPDNLGKLGEQPTHPQLLDYLATQFDDQMDWSVKKLIRAMVLSRTWQLSSKPSAAAVQADPNNTLLSHARVRRLEAEAIRDSLLAVSGRLDRTQFGSPVGGNAPRRSVYVSVIRNSLDPFLRAFDFPEPFSSTGRRDATNVPAQSLMLMNDPQITNYANAWVDRAAAAQKNGWPGLERGTSETPVSDAVDAAQIDFMFQTAFARRATKSDVNRVQQYMANARQQMSSQRQQVEQLKTQRTALQNQITSVLEPVRTRLLADAKRGKVVPEATVPKPVHRWEFETDAKDTIGTAHAELRGGAKLEDGALVVRNGGHAVTAPLNSNLREKTLEAWVQLDNLNQRAGGVITVQTPNGVFFDSIVYAERDARRWLSGSNNFARTQPFATAPAEDLAHKEPIHIAIAYHKDGRVVGYRNGKPYGKGYKSDGPYAFNKQAVVSFGLRHLPAGGNRMLSGRILTAQIYDRALSTAEVEATSKTAPFFVSEAAVLSQLSDEQRTEISNIRSKIQTLSSQVESMGNIPDPNDNLAIWRDVAKAMFTFKEFIYVR
jgi:hypothetical protein